MGASSSRGLLSISLHLPFQRGRQKPLKCANSVTCQGHQNLSPPWPGGEDAATVKSRNGEHTNNF